VDYAHFTFATRAGSQVQFVLGGPKSSATWSALISDMRSELGIVNRRAPIDWDAPARPLPPDSKRAADGPTEQTQAPVLRFETPATEPASGSY
jgi:hypothetical protein